MQTPKQTDFEEGLKLADLQRVYQKNPKDIHGKKIKFYGWIRRLRIGGRGSIVFVDVYDGTKVGALMCIASRETYNDQEKIEPDYVTLSFEQLSQPEFLSLGTSVVVFGEIVHSPEDVTQDYEMSIHSLQLIGKVENYSTYPIQKSSEKKLVSLRKHPFLRTRSQVMQSIFRIRSKALFGIHTFMDQENCMLTDPNILTISDCEGAGETFTVQPSIFSKDSEGKDIPVSLTVSSQLPLESSITGFTKVYTCQKSFRAEKSDTNKHLAEFLHVEYEEAFTTLDKLLSFTERYVKYVINFTLERCKEDFDFLESKLSPDDLDPTRSLMQESLTKPFVRIKHKQAIELIVHLVKTKYKLPDEYGKLKRVKVKVIPKYEDDLGTEHEKLLVKYFGWINTPEKEREEKLKNKHDFGAFVFVTHWPIAIKSFYMKQCDDESGECESFDLLAPRVGELFGGSMREWRYDKLVTEIKKRGMNVDPIQWFIDLRKSGSMPHGGWGFGFDRFVMLLTGIPSVRDGVLLPVYYGKCDY